ncbi:MAG: glycosyltransferase family 4 protein [Chitinophagaceae bacterium]
MIVISHPTGNANARAALAGIQNAGLLERFYTAIAAFPEGMLDKVGGIGPFKEIRKRRFDPALRKFTVTSPWLEAGRMVAGKAGFPSLVKHETGIFCIDAVYKNIDAKVASGLQKAARRGVQAVYAYEDAALLSFRKAKQLNMACIYDLPIGYWRAAWQYLQAEKERWPEWAPTLTGFGDSDKKLAAKDEELSLADIIFVASSFTAKTLAAYPGKLSGIKVVPYGFPAVGEEKKYEGFSNNRPLKLLFVGGLSQRKGLANLFAAVEKFNDKVSLTIVGGKPNHMEVPVLNAALAKHNWIPALPHEEILKIMRQHDVFVFPSLFEGFGLVITEAMSQGTPVITTERTCGPDIIEHGKNGWIVEAGSTAAIEEMISELLSNPQQIAAAGKEAMETARMRPWKVYGSELANAIWNFTDKKSKRNDQQHFA